MHGYLIGQESFNQTFLCIPHVHFQQITIVELQKISVGELPVLVECVSQHDLEAFAQHGPQNGLTLFVYSADLYYSALSLGFHTLRCESGWELHGVMLLECCTEYARSSEQLRQEDEAREALSVREMLHDLNNAVSIMIGKCQLLRQEKLNESAQTLLEQMLEAGRHASAVFKQFSKRRTQAVQPQSLTDIVYTTKRTIGLLQYGMDSRISFQVELPEQALLIPLSSAAYTRILLNLLLNAQEAMPDGGELCLSVTTGWHPDRYSLATAVLLVSDTGEGIPIEQQQRIFEPFYTTKGEHGTGLGLSAVQNLLNRCGGRALLSSPTLKGTTFELHFPLVEQPKLERVIWVDPIPTWNSESDQMLRRAGFEVLTVASFNLVCTVLESERSARALIIDAELLISNPAYLRQLKMQKPLLKILLTHSRQNTQNRLEYPILEHPFTPEQLAHSLQKIIA